MVYVVVVAGLAPMMPDAAGFAPDAQASAVPVNGLRGYAAPGMLPSTAALSAATGYVPVFFTAKSSHASWKLCMFAFTLPSRARSCMATKLGMAIAARIPMMTTTIMSSMRVKPFSLRNMVVLLSCAPSLAIGELKPQQGRLTVALDGVAAGGNRIRAVAPWRRRIGTPE